MYTSNISNKLELASYGFAKQFQNVDSKQREILRKTFLLGAEYAVLMLDNEKE